MQKGFTLIELLITFALVAVLASVILVSFPSVQNKFRASRVTSSMSQIRSETSVVYHNTQDYSNVDCAIVDSVCACLDSEIETLCNDVQNNSVEDVIFRLNDDDSGFCVVAHLQGVDEYFCIDGAMRAKQYAVSPAINGNQCEAACENQDDCACE